MSTSGKNNPSPETGNETRDSLFASPIGEIEGFSFDAKVAAVFPDMLDRSIPGYHTIISQTGLLAKGFARPQTQLFDLGCSLGATALAMQSKVQQEDCRIVAVDNSQAMLDACKELTANGPPGSPAIDCRCEDIAHTDIDNASVVALNFTLQFVDPANRDSLCKKIAAGLVPGGICILSEKVVFEEPELNELHIDMYHAFKRANGYSDLEISQKRTALENVLVPDTVQQHRDRLLKAGFREVTVWFQCFNFMSLIALK